MIIGLVVQILFGCTAKNKVFWVNGVKAPCVGVSPMECLLTYEGKNPQDAAWELFYDHINGFVFEPGVQQQVKVSVEHLDPKDVPQDASTIRYSLITVLDKQNMQGKEMEGEWILSELNGKKVTTSELPPTANFSFATSKVTGYDGCNQYFSQFTQSKENQLTFSPFGGTKKMCPNMDAANEFLQAMSSASQFSVAGNKMSITNTDGKEILLFTRKTNQSFTRLHDIWVATSIYSKPLNRQEKLPTLEIYVEEMRVLGTDGCNNFTGKIREVTDEVLIFEPFASTRKICPNMQTPNLFNEAIQKAYSYQFVDRGLVLYDENNEEVISFTKVD